jgi:mRNA-degrading endonuclease toxin of MazEF toxin-antitoxin module
LTEQQRGDIYFAPFLYSDGEESKPRPVCVVSVPTFNAGPDVLVAMVTSSLARRERPGFGDVVLEDWSEAGLWRPSVVRAGRLFAFERRLLQRMLGSLSTRDMSAVDRGLSTILGLS